MGSVLRLGGFSDGNGSFVVMVLRWEGLFDGKGSPIGRVL